MPASATNIAFATSYTQQGVDFELSVGAESFKISQPAIFKPGQTYFVKVSTAAKAPVDYRLTITIK